jgi:Na+/proline symporter
MRTFRFRNPNIRPRIGPARSSDGAFFRAIFVLGIAMLALLAVLLLASVAGFVELLPLFAVAAVLFVVAAVLVWRWAITEAELAAPPPNADQVSKDEGVIE